MIRFIAFSFILIAVSWAHAETITVEYREPPQLDLAPFDRFRIYRYFAIVLTQCLPEKTKGLAVSS
jgi:hypothetical protein